jgi:hypothetical protein
MRHTGNIHIVIVGFLLQKKYSLAFGTFDQSIPQVLCQSLVPRKKPYDLTEPSPLRCNKTVVFAPNVKNLRFTTHLDSAGVTISTLLGFA